MLGVNPVIISVLAVLSVRAASFVVPLLIMPLTLRPFVFVNVKVTDVDATALVKAVGAAGIVLNAGIESSADRTALYFNCSLNAGYEVFAVNPVILNDDAVLLRTFIKVDTPAVPPVIIGANSPPVFGEDN